MTDLATIVFVIMAVIVTSVVIIVACYGMGIIIYHIVWMIQDKTTEIERRHETRFLWYYRMGLCESSWLLEPRVAKSYCWAFTPWSK